MLLYLVYKSLQVSTPKFIPVRTGLLVAQDTGKTKHIQSKTGDASLAIQENRRLTIYRAGKANTRKIKETRTQLGSTTGAIETFMISRICECLCLPYDVVYDGGDDNDEFCAYDGDGGNVLDAGDDTTKACGI